MNRNSCNCCHPPKKKKKTRRRKCSGEHRKIGAAMLMLGLATVMFLILPIKCWVLLLAVVLVICGIMLVK